LNSELKEIQILIFSVRITGVGMINRTLANKAKPTMQYTDLGNGKWSQKTISLKNFEIIFTLGEEFDETTADDRKSKVGFWVFEII